MIVPDGKLIIIGSRKYIEGEKLPPHIYFDMPDEMTVEEAEKKADEIMRPRRGKW